MSANTALRVERVDLGERSYDVLVGRGAVAAGRTRCRRAPGAPWS
ncbi:MAG: hypothetical protein R2705_03575 [Ilumatobacteraceae bacterium]